MEVRDGVIGIGVDLVKISRIRQAIGRRGDRFVARIISETERDERPKNVALELWVAGRFAAKEACLKALGTGWAVGLAFTQVQVLEDGTLALNGRAGERAEHLGVVNARVSLAEQGDMMAAVVILDR